MQTSNRFFDDLAKVAGGAASSFSSLKNEINSMIHQQMQRLLADADVVPRDEFDAIKAVATKARTEQEKLEKRVSALEARLGVKPAAKAKTRTKAKTATKSKPKAKATGAKEGTDTSG